MKDELLWKKITVENPIAFGLHNGFNDLTELHNKWLRLFLLSEKDITLQAHRGSYKTTCLAIGISLLLIVYPELSIIFLRKTDTDVKEVVSLIKRLLLSHIYQRLSINLHGKEIVLIRDSAFEIETNLNKNPSGAPQLLGIGIRASITGKHADLIVTDDIINISDRISRAERERTKLAYQELQNVKNRDGRFINCGTPWHKNDAFNLMPNPKKYDCYSTGLINHKELQILRKSMTPSLFSANYELQHISDEDQMFSSPVIDGGTNTEKIYDGICHIDASYGGSDGTAFTIANKYENKIYVYGILHQKHVDDCLPEFEDKRQLYRAGTCYMERNADKGYLAEKVIVPVQTYHEKTNKFIKISTHLKSEWENIVFIKGTDPDYINEILDYTENAEHDDAPDSLASLLRVIDKDKTKINKTKMINNLKRMGL